MGSHYVGCNTNTQKAKDKEVHHVNKQIVKCRCRRIIALDSALKLQVNPRRYEKPKINLVEVCRRQEDHTVFDNLCDRKSLINPKTNPKVNFVNFIDFSKVQTSENNNKPDVSMKQEFQHILVKDEYSEISLLGSNKSTNSSLINPLINTNEYDRISKTSNNVIVKNSKPFLNLVARTKTSIDQNPLILKQPKKTVDQVSIASRKPKLTLEQINLKIEQQRHKIQLKVRADSQAAKFSQKRHKMQLEVEPKSFKSTETQQRDKIKLKVEPKSFKSSESAQQRTKIQIGAEPKLVKSVETPQQRPKIQLGLQPKSVILTETPPPCSKFLINCGNISKVLNEKKLLNKKISLQRVIKLHPLNLNTFKSSQENKKQLSTILKTVIKNNLSNELQQNSIKKVFPVALKSLDHKDINLMDLHSSDQSNEQILGL